MILAIYIASTYGTSFCNTIIEQIYWNTRDTHFAKIVVLKKELYGISFGVYCFIEHMKTKNDCHSCCNFALCFSAR